MIELRDELLAAPVYDYQYVPITTNHHKWWLQWYRRDDGGFFFAFVSPRKRRYSFCVERGKSGGCGRVTYADVEIAHGKAIASYCEAWGDKPDRLDTVIRLTPRHILRKLSMLLDALPKWIYGLSLAARSCVFACFYWCTNS